MEKYMPIYIQRQLSEVLNYILPDKLSRWRLQWFNDLKIPLLTSLILIDNGDNSLDQRIETLHKLVHDHII